MIKLPSTRLLTSIAVLVLFLIFLVAVLFITNLSFSVWEQLQQKPDWLIWIYLSAIILLSIFFARIIWRLLLAKKKQAVKKRKSTTTVDTMEAIAQRIEKMGLESAGLKNISENLSAPSIPTLKPVQTGKDNRQSGETKQHESPLDSRSETINKDFASSEAVSSNSPDIEKKWASEFEASSEVAAIRAELQEYGRRKAQQTLYIALFGDISSGKSSLIKALIANDSNAQEQAIDTSVIGGTTREIYHYHWTIANEGAEQQYILTDMPGLNEQFAELDVLATDEVKRTHIAVYLCDGDLTASQFNELKAILLLKKPCIVAVNKSDRYSKEELQLIINKIQQCIETLIPAESTLNVPVLTISAGAMRDFIRLTPEGQEQRVQRPIEADVRALQEQLQGMMQSYGVDQLEQLREKSVASMVNNKLDELDARFKHSQSRRIVSSYTKKAVVVALATITPGTDILVQGYLGIQLIKDLCKLYEVPASDINANKLIELIQSRMDKTLPLLLAIAGNGFKAFPGVGTVTGGLMHAVAYGMIFDTLGRSVARTLEVTGELSPSLISDLYKEQLGENIQSRTKDFIKLVLKLRKSD
ncbi:MAG: GTPase domain-containing protein [Gammaproteobacteria bacterium]|nr:GTPase domain-containing protein [Gammaproteobacteria bacterium]